ncbi:DUF397 domain-containing protein [Streptomyces sp. NBC_00986]|uniref:DUF397 domain-containing protein n=1 Tax=Streptomyces sp. NBC_00986 TaxID=2903702 RepID=UPI0038630D60|nr:DUF397 domain-containing protein [Streptomyces sp. NBC_00986]
MSGTGTLRWFKSSYSDGGGGNCVEVALDWRKSSYSDGGGGDCVEIATCPHTIHIRDSKNPDGGIVTVSDAAWRTFLPSPHPSPKKV